MTTTVRTATCPDFCAIHDHELDVCLGATLEIDFTGPNQAAGLTDTAYIALAHSPEDGTAVSVCLDHLGAAYMTVDAAEQLMLALAAMVATARRGGTGGA